MRKNEIKFDSDNAHVAFGRILSNVYSNKEADKVVRKVIHNLFERNELIALIAFKIFCEGKHLKTVADELGITESYVGRIRNKIRVLLKRELRDVLMTLNNYVDPPMLEVKVVELSPEDKAFFAEFPDLSVRAANALRRHEIFTVKDLTEKKLNDLHATRMGKKAEIEIIEFLKTRGLSLKDE